MPESSDASPCVPFSALPKPPPPDTVVAVELYVPAEPPPLTVNPFALTAVLIEP